MAILQSLFYMVPWQTLLIFYWTPTKFRFLSSTAFWAVTINWPNACFWDKIHFLDVVWVWYSDRCDWSLDPATKWLGVFGEMEFGRHTLQVLVRARNDVNKPLNVICCMNEWTFPRRSGGKWKRNFLWLNRAECFKNRDTYISISSDPVIKS